ncbi:unnamed protein product [Arctia plantaginis]|uniref:Uncharacterized protein n=1 Tax=Arctia plantaginis TaxID=874455 RepID=A0A8S0Z6R3_ARCPL|nr:unnamed protein product [Arctia plantaginis]
MTADIVEDSEDSGTLVREVTKTVVEVWWRELCVRRSAVRYRRRAVRGLRCAPSSKIRAISTCAGVTASAVILTTSPDLRYRLLTASTATRALFATLDNRRNQSPVPLSFKDVQMRTPSPINMSNAHFFSCSKYPLNSCCVKNLLLLQSDGGEGRPAARERYVNKHK